MNSLNNNRHLSTSQQKSTTISNKVKLPVFQQDFDIAKEKLGSPRLVYAWTIINFHCKKATVDRDNKLWAPNMVDRLCYWMVICPQTARSILGQFEALGMIGVSLYRTNKITSLHVCIIDPKGVPVPYIELRSTRKAIKLHGDVESAFIFFKINFSSHDSKITIDSESYWVTSREKLADWAKLGLRAIDTILKTLLKKGAIARIMEYFNERSKSHFRITESGMKTFLNAPVVDKLSLLAHLIDKKSRACSASVIKYIDKCILHKGKKKKDIPIVPSKIDSEDAPHSFDKEVRLSEPEMELKYESQDKTLNNLLDKLRSSVKNHLRKEEFGFD